MKKLDRIERYYFESSNIAKGLDLRLVEDSWGREEYMHSHIGALFDGWNAAIKENKMTTMIDVDIIFDLREEVKYLKGQITYLQEELSSAENDIMVLNQEVSNLRD